MKLFSLPRAILALATILVASNLSAAVNCTPNITAADTAYQKLWNTSTIPASDSANYPEYKVIVGQPLIANISGTATSKPEIIVVTKKIDSNSFDAKIRILGFNTSNELVLLKTLSETIDSRITPAIGNIDTDSNIEIVALGIK